MSEPVADAPQKLLVKSMVALGLPVARMPLLLPGTPLRSFWLNVNVAPLLMAIWEVKILYWRVSVEPELNVRLSQAKVLLLALNCPPALTRMRVVSLPLKPLSR